MVISHCEICGSLAKMTHQDTILGARWTAFDCGNSYDYETEKWANICSRAYGVAAKYGEALKFYATAMASDIAYDGGAKARVALLPVV